MNVADDDIIEKFQLFLLVISGIIMRIDASIC